MIPIFARKVWRSILLQGGGGFVPPVPSILYENNDGNVIDWVITYNGHGGYILVDGGSYQNFNSSLSTNSKGLAKYVDQLWTDYYFQYTYTDSTVNYPTGVMLGVRVEGNVSYPDLTNGYWFYHKRGTGTWFPPPGFFPVITFSNIITNNSCTVTNGSVLKMSVEGQGALTTIKIYVDGILYYEANGPSVSRDTGTIGTGMATNYFLHYFLNNLLVFGV